MAIYKRWTATQNAVANAEWDLLDGGTAEFRTGSIPAANGSITGTLVGTCTLGSPAFGAPSSGAVTANSITPDTSADNSGTVTYAVLRKSDSSVHSIVDVTATGGSGALQMDVDGTPSTVVTAGQTITITSLTFTAPAT